MIQRSELNLPNSITVSRILLLPFCAYALFKNGGDDSTWMIISFMLFFLVGVTDLLDGKVARSRNTVTEFGKLLDPIADKALIGTALVGLSILHRLPWWVTVVILTREIGITVFRFIVIKRGVIPANRGGKAKTIVQNFAAGFFYCLSQFIASQTFRCAINFLRYQLILNNKLHQEFSSHLMW